MIGIRTGSMLLLSRFSHVLLCATWDGSPPGSPVPGILQARTLEWVAISFSNAWKWKVEVKSLSRVQLLAIPWTAAYQAPPSMGFSIGVHYTIFSEFEICYYKKVLKSHHFLQKSVPLPSTPYKAHTHVCYCPVPTVSHESHPWNYLKGHLESRLEHKLIVKKVHFYEQQNTFHHLGNSKVF